MITKKTITDKMQVLVVETIRVDLIAITNAIKTTCSDVCLKYAENIKDAMVLSSVSTFDFVIINADILEGANNMKLLPYLKANDATHIIMLKRGNQPQKIEDVIKAGISEVLNKNEITGLTIMNCFKRILSKQLPEKNNVNAEVKLEDLEARLKIIIGQLNDMLNVEGSLIQSPIIQSTDSVNKKINSETFTQMENDLTNLHILVAEDNDINRFIMEKMLMKLGIKSTFTINGNDTLNRFSNARFDMVLMDIEMPGMNGYQTTIAIRENLKNTTTPIIAMTGHVMKEVIEKCFHCGMNDYIAKPFTEEALKLILTKWKQKNPDTVKIIK